jgi:AcrR family transcriptional regulator
MIGGAVSTDAATERILRAASDLLHSGGIDAVSTCGVAIAAGVQPPTLYRQFSDRDGMLDALTNYVLHSHLADQRRQIAANDDPVAGLRTLWDQHVDIGLTHPDCYQLTFGRSRPGKVATVARESLLLLRRAVERLTHHGALAMSVERASQLFHSCGVGFVMTQISTPPEYRDPRLSYIARENALSAILSSECPQGGAYSGLAGRASALREVLREHAPPLTILEQGLLGE